MIPATKIPEKLRTMAGAITSELSTVERQAVVVKNVPLIDRLATTTSAMPLSRPTAAPPTKADRAWTVSRIHPVDAAQTTNVAKPSSGNAVFGLTVRA